MILLRGATLSLGLALGAHAQVTLSDLGSTAPIGFNTGHLGPFDQRYSFDGQISPAVTPVDSHGQSFTTTVTGDLEYLYIAYNAGGNGSFEVFIDNAYAGGGVTEVIANATSAGAAFTINLAEFVPAAPAGLSGSSTEGNATPVYWFRLNFTGVSVPLTAGQTSAFFVRAVSEVAGDSNFIFAPHYKAGTNPYAGGTVINGANFAVTGAGVSAANSDFGFAVSVTNPDTDGDGLLNAQETAGQNASGVLHGYGPTDPFKPDTDDDGLKDGQETAGLNQLDVSHGFGATNPNLADSESDGMDDLYEVTNSLNGGLNPNADDASGNLDGDTGNPELFAPFFANIDEYLGVFTGGVRTRADKLDTEGDGLPDTVENASGTWLSVNLTGSNPANSDSDGDTLPDGQENPDLAFPGAGLLPTNSNPNLTDTDTDGLRDDLEIALGTKPASSDTDGDTFGDRVELLNGSDPKIAASVPSATGVIAGSDFSVLPVLQTGGGVTTDATSSLLPGSAENGRVTSNTDNSGAMVSFANPNSVAYYSVDVRYTGTLNSQGFNVVSSNVSLVSTSLDTHCGIRFIPGGSIGYFNGATFIAAGAPAGTHVAGNTYTVQFIHDIPNNAYTIKVFDRTNGDDVIFEVNPAVPVRNQAPGATLYFGTGIQQGTTNAFQLRIDNLFVSTAPISPGTVTPPVVPLVVTAVFFDGGDLKVTFSPGGAGYVLTSSDNLSAPFTVEAAATYDGVSTFTIPAAALNPGRDFFRVETAP